MMLRFYSLGHDSQFRRRTIEISEKPEFMRELIGTTKQRLLGIAGSLLIVAIAIFVEGYY